MKLLCASLFFFNQKKIDVGHGGEKEKKEGDGRNVRFFLLLTPNGDKLQKSPNGRHVSYTKLIFFVKPFTQNIVICFIVLYCAIDEIERSLTIGKMKMGWR